MYAWHLKYSSLLPSLPPSILPFFPQICILHVTASGDDIAIRLKQRETNNQAHQHFSPISSPPSLYSSTVHSPSATPSNHRRIVPPEVVKQSLFLRSIHSLSPLTHLVDLIISLDNSQADYEWQGGGERGSKGGREEWGKDEIEFQLPKIVHPWYLSWYDKI